MPAQKIATCCYCGTRAALVLRGRDRHELSCSACGAPLHDLKMLRADHPVGRGPAQAGPPRQGHVPPRGYDPRKRKKRRKGLGRRFLEEAWDALEDIFD